MVYTKSSYINTFPAAIRQGIRKSIAAKLKGEYVDYFGDYMKWDKLTPAAKSDVLDDICNNRLSAIEGLNYQYWVDKANSKKSKRK